MYLTTTDIKSLSKNIKSTFTFSAVADILNKIVKKDSFKDMLKVVIGKKGNETINQRKSDEIVAKLLGSRTYNTLLSSVGEKESLKDYEIKSSLEDILKNLNNQPDNSTYNHYLRCLNENIARYFAEREKDFATEKQDIDKLDELLSNDKIDLTLIALINSVKDKEITKVFIDSYNELTECEIRMVLTFENDITIEIDAKLIMCSATGTIDWITEEKTTINELSIDDSEQIFNEFISSILNGFTDASVTPPNEKAYTAEELKRLSLFVSEFTRHK